MKLISDENWFETSNLPSCTRACALTLPDCVAQGLLLSPDSKQVLRFVDDENLKLTDGEYQYSLIDGSPVLYPKVIENACVDGILPLDYFSNALIQYNLISQI